MQERHKSNCANFRFLHDLIASPKTDQLGNFMGAEKITQLYGRKVLPEANPCFFWESDFFYLDVRGELGDGGLCRGGKEEWYWSWSKSR